MKEENPWKIISSEIKYDNQWISVTEYDVLNPAGKEGIYGVVNFKNAAITVLPLDDDYNTYIVGQYRFPINEYSWEVPEGGGNKNLSPLESAKRELLEETGLKAEEWTLIQELHLSNSATDEVGYIYVAKKLSQHDAEPEETESLQIKKLPFDELYEMVMSNKIKDALTINAVLKAKLLMLEGKL
ncbi:MAG: NUDIX hydrolase [Pseudomonadota bacterium]